MNEAHINAAFTALENQRNSALNTLVNTEAALIVAKAKISELETELNVFKATAQTVEKAT